MDKKQQEHVIKTIGKTDKKATRGRILTASLATALLVLSVAVPTAVAVPPWGPPNTPCPGGTGPWGGWVLVDDGQQAPWEPIYSCNTSIANGTCRGVFTYEGPYKGWEEHCEWALVFLPDEPVFVNSGPSPVGPINDDIHLKDLYGMGVGGLYNACRTVDGPLESSGIHLPGPWPPCRALADTATTTPWELFEQVDEEVDDNLEDYACHTDNPTQSVRCYVFTGPQEVLLPCMGAPQPNPSPGGACFIIPDGGHSASIWIHDDLVAPVGGTFFTYDASGSILTHGDFCGAVSTLFHPDATYLRVALDPLHIPCNQGLPNLGFPTTGKIVVDWFY